MPSLAELRKQKLAEKKLIQEEKIISEKKEKIQLEELKPPKPPKKEEEPKEVSEEAMEFKTDELRTSVFLTTKKSARGRPPILKQQMLDFLETHEPILKDNKWYWKEIQ